MFVIKNSRLDHVYLHQYRTERFHFYDGIYFMKFIFRENEKPPENFQIYSSSVFISRIEYLRSDSFQSIKIVVILTNSETYDEIRHFMIFHLDLHYLPMYTFTGVQYKNG